MKVKRGKNLKSVEVKSPDRHQDAYCNIHATNNGYQWSAVSIGSRFQAQKLFRLLGKYLEENPE